MFQIKNSIPFTISLAIAQAFDEEYKDVSRVIATWNALQSSKSAILRSLDTRSLEEKYASYRLTRDALTFLAWTSPIKNRNKESRTSHITSATKSGLQRTRAVGRPLMKETQPFPA